METAAKEKSLQICNVEEEQGVSKVEDASGLRVLSSFSLCFLVGLRMEEAGSSLGGRACLAWQRSGDFSLECWARCSGKSTRFSKP